MSKVWKPPFCSIDAIELDCPSCKGKGCVQVIERETYFDSSEYEAYCSDCHVLLEVQAQVSVSFSDPEILEI